MGCLLVHLSLNFATFAQAVCHNCLANFSLAMLCKLNATFARTFTKSGKLCRHYQLWVDFLESLQNKFGIKRTKLRGVSIGGAHTFYWPALRCCPDGDTHGPYPPAPTCLLRHSAREPGSWLGAPRSELGPGRRPPPALRSYKHSLHFSALGWKH